MLRKYGNLWIFFNPENELADKNQHLRTVCHGLFLMYLFWRKSLTLTNFIIISIFWQPTIFQENFRVTALKVEDCAFKFWQIKGKAIV